MTNGQTTKKKPTPVIKTQGGTVFVDGKGFSVAPHLQSKFIQQQIELFRGKSPSRIFSEQLRLHQREVETAKLRNELLEKLKLQKDKTIANLKELFNKQIRRREFSSRTEQVKAQSRLNQSIQSINKTASNEIENIRTSQLEDLQKQQKKELPFEKAISAPPISPKVREIFERKKPTPAPSEVPAPKAIIPFEKITPAEIAAEKFWKIKEGAFELVKETPAEKELKEFLLKKRIPSRKPAPMEDFVLEEIKRKELIPTGTEIVNLTPREKTFFEKFGLNPNDPDAIALKSNVEDISRKFNEELISKESAEREWYELEKEFVRKKIKEGYAENAASGVAFGLIRGIPIIGRAVDAVLVGSLLANRDKVIAQGRTYPKETAIAAGLFIIGAKAGGSLVRGVKLRTQPNFEQIKARSRYLSNKQTTKLVDQVREFDSGLDINLKRGKITDTVSYDVKLANGTIYRILQYIKLDRPIDKGGIRGTVEAIGVELNPKAKGIKIGRGIIPGEREIMIARGIEQVGLRDAQGRFTIFKLRPKNTILGRLAQRFFGSGQVYDIAAKSKITGAKPGLIRRKAAVRTETAIINIKNISGRLFRQIERIEKKIKGGRRISLSEIKRLVNLRRQLEGKEIFTEKEFREAGFRAITDINILSLLKRLKVTKQIKGELGVMDVRRRGKGYQFDVIFKEEGRIPGIRRKILEERAAIGKAFTKPVKRLITIKKKPIKERPAATIVQLESRLKTIRGGLELLKKDLPAKEKRISLIEFKKRMDKLFPTKGALLKPFEPAKKVKGISKADLIARATKLFGKRGGQLLKKELKKPEVKGMTLTQFKARMTRLFGTRPPELLKIPIPKRKKSITKAELIKKADKLFGKEKARLLEKELPKPEEKGVTIKELRKRLIKINRQARIEQIKLARQTISRRIKPIIFRMKELTKKKKTEGLSTEEKTRLQALKLEEERLRRLPSIVQPGGIGRSILPLQPAVSAVTAAVAMRRIAPPRVGIPVFMASGVLIRDIQLSKGLERLNQAQKNALLQSQNQRTRILETTAAFSSTRTKQLEKVNQTLRERLSQLQLQKQKLIQEPGIRRRRPLVTEPKPPTFPRIPPLPPVKIKEIGIRKRPFAPLKPKKEPGWNAFVKQKGKFLRANVVPLKRDKALDLSSWISDRTTSRQFLIKKAKKPAQFPKIKAPINYFKTTQKKYRPFKIRKGLRIGMHNRWIERTKYSIDTLGEKKQLSAAREIARLKKRFMRRIPKPKFKRIK